MEVTDDEIPEAAHRSFFCFTLSDDSTQKASHLLAHRLGALNQLRRIPGFSESETCINKSDGAAIDNSCPSWLALGVLDNVIPNSAQYTESTQSQPGDGKAGPDRFHAEVGRKGQRELRKGKDQTDAKEHADTLVAGEGLKASVVCTVDVPRGSASSKFQSLNFTHISGKTPANCSDGLEELSLRQWSRTPGLAWIKPLRKEATPAQTEKARQFVDACFKQGETSSQHIPPEACRKRMDEALDDLGLPLFGPGSEYGPVWETHQIQGRTKV